MSGLKEGINLSEEQNIEALKKRYNIVPGSLHDRSINDMLTRMSEHIVRAEVIKFFEEGGLERENAVHSEAMELLGIER